MHCEVDSNMFFCPHSSSFQVKEMEILVNVFFFNKTDCVSSFFKKSQSCLYGNYCQGFRSNSLQASRLALCTSGTVAVELQLARLPCVVAYRAHLLTELFIKYKAKIPYISLPNILLNSPVIPEALLQDCKPMRLASLLM